MVKVLEASKGSWPFKKYALGIVVAFEYGETLSTACQRIKRALVDWQAQRAKACRSLALTFEAESELWPQITDSVKRNAQEEAFIAPFFTQLEDVTLALVTPDGDRHEEVQITFREAA
jgi:hypothetical protein